MIIGHLNLPVPIDFDSNSKTTWAISHPQATHGHCDKVAKSLKNRNTAVKNNNLVLDSLQSQNKMLWNNFIDSR